MMNLGFAIGAETPIQDRINVVKAQTGHIPTSSQIAKAQNAAAKHRQWLKGIADGYPSASAVPADVMAVVNQKENEELEKVRFMLSGGRFHKMARQDLFPSRMPWWKYQLWFVELHALPVAAAGVLGIVGLALVLKGK